MKILVHDFCGHAFTLQLASQLSARGHQVDYVYFASEPGPKGNFAHAAAQPDPPTIYGLKIDGQYRKDAFLSRRRFDIQYAKQISDKISVLNPDIVISGNTPTEVQNYVINATKKTAAKFVYWMQDFYSVAASKLLKKKFGFFGSVIGHYFTLLDQRHLASSDSIVLITKEFFPLAARWSKRPEIIDIVENWGVLGEIAQRPHRNPWSEKMRFADSFNFIYSGTLGLKHNPELLAVLARQAGPRANVIVISQGASVPYLEARKRAWGLDNLHILPLQPFADVPDVLGCADVVVATIETDAGTFSVPSKVLSYLCAGRPIVLAAPAENLAAQMVNQAGAGMTVEPEDEAGFLTAALALFDDPDRAKFGDRGRAYAEKNFDIAQIAARFETIFAATLSQPGGR